MGALCSYGRKEPPAPAAASPTVAPTEAEATAPPPPPPPPLASKAAAASAPQADPQAAAAPPPAALAVAAPQPAPLSARAPAAAASGAPQQPHTTSAESSADARYANPVIVAAEREFDALGEGGEHATAEDEKELARFDVSLDDADEDIKALQDRLRALEKSVEDEASRVAAQPKPHARVLSARGSGADAAAAEEPAKRAESGGEEALRHNGDAAQRPSGAASPPRRELEDVEDQLIQAEQVFHSKLSEFAKQYLRPLRDPSEQQFLDLSSTDVHTIFSSVDLIMEVHQLIYEELMDEDTIPERVSDVYVKHAPYFGVYAVYARGFERSIAVLNRLGSNKKLLSFLRLRMMSGNLPSLMSCLMLPFEHILQLSDLLSQVLAATPRSDDQYEELARAVERIRATADEVRAAKDEAERLSWLIDVRNTISNLVNPSVVLKPTRKYLRRGPLAVVSPSGERETFVFFLFNDWLLWTDSRFSLQDQIEFNASWLRTQDGNDARQFRICDKGGAVRLVLECESEAERRGWQDAVQQCLDVLWDEQHAAQ